MVRRSLHRLLWFIAFLGLTYAFLTTFVVQVRYVDSGSMEPTIFGSKQNGESVLVRLDESLPKRYEIIVVHGEDNGLLVKRVWGLPQESIAIRYGDVFINDELLPATAARPKPITVFDDRWHDLAKFFVTEQTVWTQESDEWLVSAAHVAPRSEGGLIILHNKIYDSYLDRDHRIIQGTQLVNDLVARVELRFEEWLAGGGFRIDLREWGDSFEALVEPIDELTLQITLLRSTAEKADIVLKQEQVSFRADAWNQLEFSNIDNVLKFSIKDENGRAESISAGYDANTFDPLDHARSGKTFAHQVQFAGMQAQLRVRSVSLARDLFFTSKGQHAVDGPMQLGSAQVMVLGDNSGRSRDGREFGPVTFDQLYGRAVHVVRPFSSWRSLENE